ncbi:MAG: aminoglycoside phosphotransferase family protein [Anaerolineae bacterium]|nr:aminoglycoside phosphotransferase family protein [Anaerolineae bacterium]
MLEKPDIQDSAITQCLGDDFGLHIAELEFLPLGADRNTAVYKAVAENGIAYFVKLRSGDFNAVSVIVPKVLQDQGVAHIIAPIPAQNGALWAEIGAFQVTVYPFVTGKDGYEITLSDRHWIEFGQTFKGIHTATLPPEVTARIPRETYSDSFRDSVRRFQAQVEETPFDDPVSAALAKLLKDKRAIVDTLVRRAERLAGVLQRQPPPFVLCHADIHAGNLLIEPNGTLHVVDWDTMILAPKERDLMFVGGGLFVNHRPPEQESQLFYRGYGETQIDPVALAYYRYERIVQDIAAYCEQIFLTSPDDQDRAVGLRQLSGQFAPNQVIDMAFRTDLLLPPELQSL